MANQMIVRIDPALKDKVHNLARAEGKNVSEVVRELLEEYVRNRDIGTYVDDLWERIGSKLNSRGIGREDVRRVINEVRSQK